MRDSIGGYPKGFWVCASVDIIERFTYILGRSLILIFAVTEVASGGLGLSKATGATMQSFLTAFAFLGPLLGGVVADNYIGARFTTPVGMVVVGIGYYCGSLAESPVMVYIMILCVSIGLGLFKNGAMIGRIVTNPTHIDAAFSLRYTLINVGAFIGALLTGVLYKDVFANGGVLGFSQCFKLAAILMFLGAVYFIWGWRFMGDVGRRPFCYEKIEVESKEDETENKNSEIRKVNTALTKVEKKRIGAIFLVSGGSVVFWIFWNLAYLQVYYYWTENMNWIIAGYEVPVTWFDAVNALFCIMLGPIMAALWLKLASRSKGDMSLFRKMGFGMIVLGGSYFFMAVLDSLGEGIVSVLWLIIFAFILALGEMFFSPLGYGFISKYAPGRYLSTMMAVWGFASFIASLCYGPLFAVMFEKNFRFSHVCIFIAIVLIILALVILVLDKALSNLVDDNTVKVAE